MRDDHPQLSFDGLLDLQQPGVAIFHHLTRVKVDKMIVLPELVRALVLGAVVTELVFDHQITVQKQFDGVV